jgi:hypothetical protein
VWAVVLHYVLGGADDRGGLWWPQPMMEVVCIHIWAPR